ncbi:ABC transporter substrate-binding protein [Mixta theicola]|uniref:ABC transporter substrate-binding protein n=1 Tax=Mixta theicola TaxID=1458355 RepID=A0A2K1QEU2_9GAMM|nr:ABC transporter substrate-binding protein [Mixta theicola]PNS13554.1 ABC transporter substrate-binding protein [Mixta theicola]GLR09875.1 ABC transporter substrate-binding protein [Mixta theicola]
MKKLTLSMIAAVLTSTFTMAHADTLRMECPSTPGGKEYCKYVKNRFEAAHPGNTLQFIDLPPASDEKLALLQQLFASNDENAVDLFQSDTVWIGLLDKHTLDLTDHVADIKKDFFPGAWQNDMVNGRVKAVPSYLDAGALYYRKDLLEKYNEKPPATWEDLTRIATRIQKAERDAGHSNFWGLIFQGKSYEGLTCNALEWIDSHNGGSFIDSDGKVTINNPQAAKALDMAAAWIGKIAPPGVLGYKEEESRAVFQNGDALFMRNWPYAYVLSQGDDSALKGKVGVMSLPKGEGGKSVSALGGWQWSINAATKHPETAIALLRMVSDTESQKMAQKLLGYSPTRVALYDDKEVLGRAPYLAEFKQIFADAAPRPATQTKGQYARVSNAIYNATFDVLRGRTDGKKAVAALQQRLNRIKGKQWH